MKAAGILRRLAYGVAGLIAVVAGITILTAKPGVPALYPPADDGVQIHLVSHGWHSGIVLPREALTGEGTGAALRNIATRFRDYPRIEFGWGEARFYRATPTVNEFDWRLALSALFTPGGSDAVVQVVGLERDVRTSFPHSDIVPVPLSTPGLARLLARLDASFRLADGQPVEGGPGLYGPSLFYAGAGRFGVANVCNHWTAGLLHAAGLPITPVLDTHPMGLLLDLRWRAGLALSPAASNRTLPRTEPAAMRTKPETPPSGHPILNGPQQLTAEWAMTLPFRMARRLEDGSLVFWAPGGVLTFWIDVWGGQDGAPSDRSARLAAIEARRSDRATDLRVDRSGPVWRHSYRLREADADGRVAAFYGAAIGSSGHVQFAAFFNDEATLEAAERSFRSLAEVPASNLSKP